MKILRNIEVPTGNILVVEGDHGKLEVLSLADYGKEVNVKCDAMGLDREITKVEHHELLPLSKKWVITTSTQYGCSMNCSFCDVPKVGPGKNATTDDIVNQIKAGLSLHPEVTTTERLNIHYARMGEPTWNPNVLDATKVIIQTVNPKFKIHPVISTMMPKNNGALSDFLGEWMHIKDDLLDGDAGLQLSINSTDEAQRKAMFGGNACTIKQIASIVNPLLPCKGRKVTLNFALAGYQIDPIVLLNHFDPDHYIIKLTPMHKTDEAIKNGIKTIGDYTTFMPYKDHEMRLKDAGYDVLVFIASEYEDLGRITCGNAILSGTMPLCPYTEKDIS